MVVNDQFDGIINLGSNSLGFWEVETNDGPLLTRLVDWYEGDIAEISGNAFIKGKESQKISGKDLISYKDAFDLIMLSNELSSNDGADYQAGL